MGYAIGPKCWVAWALCELEPYTNDRHSKKLLGKKQYIMCIKCKLFAKHNINNV